MPNRQRRMRTSKVMLLVAAFWVLFGAVGGLAFAAQALPNDPEGWPEILVGASLLGGLCSFFPGILLGGVLAFVIRYMQRHREEAEGRIQVALGRESVQHDQPRRTRTKRYFLLVLRLFVLAGFLLGGLAGGMVGWNKPQDHFYALIVCLGLLGAGIFTAFGAVAASTLDDYLQLRRQDKEA